jgi:hypothetical protein
MFAPASANTVFTEHFALARVSSKKGIPNGKSTGCVHPDIGRITATEAVFDEHRSAAVAASNKIPGSNSLEWIVAASRRW